MKRNPVRLLAGAGIAAIILIYWLMVPSSSEPMWYSGMKNHSTSAKIVSSHRKFGVKSLGIGGGMPQHEGDGAQGHHDDVGGLLSSPHDKVPESEKNVKALKTHPETKNGKEILSGLKNGKDYFADYDVTKVAPPPKDMHYPAGVKTYFSYMNQEESKYNFLWMSEKPRVAMVPDFLTEEECDYMRNKASKSLQRSQVAVYKGDSGGGPVNDVRTSTQTWLNLNDPVVAKVAERIFDLTGFPPGSSEMMQVLRYGETQKYDAHNDYFDPRLYGPQQSNRAVTVFLYLDDTELGGETQFPNADGKHPTTDYKSCNRGLRVHPKKRAVTVFYDMMPDGTLDPMSLHGGCPVKKGVKWGGTLWLRVQHGGH